MGRRPKQFSKEDIQMANHTNQNHSEVLPHNGQNGCHKIINPIYKE